MLQSVSEEEQYETLQTMNTMQTIWTNTEPIHPWKAKPSIKLPREELTTVLYRVFEEVELVSKNFIALCCHTLPCMPVHMTIPLWKRETRKVSSNRIHVGVLYGSMLRSRAPWECGTSNLVCIWLFYFFAYGFLLANLQLGWKLGLDF